MAYEEFIPSDGSLLFDFGNDADVIMDFILVINTINFAFSDFETGSSFVTVSGRAPGQAVVRQ